MEHETQVEILSKLLGLREQGRDEKMLDSIAQVPVRNYTEPDVLEREMTTVFRQFPIVAGHASHVREPGSYLLSDWPAFPFVVVRDRGASCTRFSTLAGTVAPAWFQAKKNI